MRRRIRKNRRKKTRRLKKCKTTLDLRYMLIDESGSPSSNGKNTDYFLMDATIVRDISSFERLIDGVERNSRKYPGVQSNELKYHSSSDKVRREMIDKICSLKDKPHVSYVLVKKQIGDKNAMESNEVYSKSLRTLLTTTFQDAPSDDYYIVIDNIRGMRNKDVIKIIRESLKGANRYDLKVLEEGSGQRDSMNTPALQTHDFIPGALRKRHLVDQKNRNRGVRFKEGDEKLNDDTYGIERLGDCSYYVTTNHKGDSWSKGRKLK